MPDGNHHRGRASFMLPAIICLLLAVPALAVQDSMVRIRVGDSRSQAANFYADQHSISVAAAEDWIQNQERERGVRVLDDFDLPEGALMDFYRVRNHRDPEKRVEFEGRGRLVHAYSFLGRHYRDMLFGLLRSDVRDEAVALLRQARDHGFMIVPAAIDTKAAPVWSAQAPTITVIVIIPEFPHWNDPRPVSDGNTTRQDPPGTADMYFHPNILLVDPRRTYPMDNNVSAYEEFASDYYADSPGGALVSGIPVGMADTSGGWTGTPTSTSNQYHPRAGGVEMKDTMTLRTDWYNKVFNKAFTNSLSNYYYQNSHGHIDIQGEMSNIIGWQTDHHQLDRIQDPWFGGGGIYYSVQPGTPLLRPTPRAAGDPGIVRASFYSAGFTLFFKQDVTSMSLGNLELWAYTSADTDAGTSGTQPGVVRILNLSTASTLVRDPWDARRWTVLNNGWQFLPTGGTTNSSYVYAAGGAWRVYSTVPTNGLAVGQRWAWGYLAANQYYDGRREDQGTVASPGNYGNTGQGCGSLPDTLFQSNDIVRANNTSYVGNSQGNRLLSFCYYVHNGGEDTFSSSASAYQLTTLYQGSYTDPIAGTDSTSGRRPRAAPFDHDRRDHSFPNSGAVLGDGTPGHSSDTMRGHVYQMLNDRSISYTGYDRQIFVYPGSAQSEGDPNASITPHATGSVIVVPEGAGLSLLAHEIGHTFGMLDLYDNNLYGNAAVPPPIPYHFESRGAGQYSVMAHGGRVDPWHKLRGLTYGPWATVTPVTEDLGFTNIFQVERTLRDPVLLKLPSHPLSIYAMRWEESNPGTLPPGWTQSQARWDQLRDPNTWQEYFLLENRNVTGASYFGDPASRGLYVWKIDMRNIGYGGFMGGGFQTYEEAMSVIPVQADGLRELQNRGARAPFGGFTVSDGDQLGDPFPGRWNIRNLREIPTRYYNTVVGAEVDSATSWSHGAPETNNRTIMPGTPTDSFVRVLNISDPGEPMSAYVYVEPAEVIVTGQNEVPPPQDPLIPYHTVMQGTDDFPVMRLKLDNSGAYPNLSTQMATINTLRIYEVGTSLRDANIAAAKLYEVPDAVTPFDPNVHTLLKTASVVSDYVEFTNLGYTVHLNQERYLVVAYDIANDAETSPAITIGAEITNRDQFFSLSPPGTIQNRARTATGTDQTVGYLMGAQRFPISSNTAMIVNRPDVLEVASTSLAPVTTVQGSTNVPVMQLELSVDEEQGHDAVTITGLRVSQTGTARGGTDVTLVRVFHDRAGNGIIDPGDTMLGEANVAGGAGAGVANITGLNFTVTYEALAHLILAVNVSADAEPGRYVRLKLPHTSEYPAGCITLQVNPAEPPAKQDTVNYATFPHEHREAPGTEIVLTNQPPYPVPPPNHVAPPGARNYGPIWYPRGGIKIPDRSPECTFPRARNLATDTVGNPGEPDPDALRVPPLDTADVMRYEVQFSTASNFSTISHTQMVVPPHGDEDEPSFIVSVSLAPAQYWWRVRSVDTQGAQSAWSSPAATFVIANPPTPPTTPFSPVSTPPGSGNTRVTTTTPTYSWTVGTDVETPQSQLVTEVQVDANSDFSNPRFTAESQPGASTSFNWTVTDGTEALVMGGHYFWRARTRDGDGMLSAWTTAVLDFRTGQNRPPNPVSAGFAPTGGVEVTAQRPTLRWTRTTDPDNPPEDPREQLYYHVQLNTADEWTGAVVWEHETLGPHMADPVAVPLTVDLVDNLDYYWRVRAADRRPIHPAGDGLWSDWSAVQHFVLNFQNSAPSTPTPLSPIDAVRTNDWMPRLECTEAVDPDPFDGTAARPLRYRFRLKYFLNVADGLAWNPADPNPPHGYDFQYTSGPNQPWADVTTALTAPGDGYWFWSVQAEDFQGARSAWSARQWLENATQHTSNFRINRKPNPPPSPHGDWYPTGGEFLRPTPAPVFQFPRASDPDPEDPPSTLTYVAELSRSALFTTIARTVPVTPSPRDASPVTFTMPAPALSGGDWYWRVKTIDNGLAESDWSAIHHFIINTPPTAPTGPFYPSNDIVITDPLPTYSWTLGTDAETPQTQLLTVIEVDDNADFSSLHFTATSAPGANELDNPPGSPLVPGVRYFWRVKTVDGHGMDSAWSPIQSFWMGENVAPSRPGSPTGPRDNIVVTTAQPTFWWGPSTDPNPDDLPQNFTYEVQLSTSGDWGDVASMLPITNPAGGRLTPPIPAGSPVTMPIMGVQRADHPDGRLQDNRQYFWRVRCLDRVGPDGLWSNWTPTYIFWVNTVNNPPEAPNSGFSPSGGVVISAPRPPLRCRQAFDPDPPDFIMTGAPATPPWPGNAMTYTFQLRAGDNNFAAGWNYQYVVVGNTDQTWVQANLTEDLQDLTQWFWRVRAQDQLGAQSPWSAVQDFHLDTGNVPPTLTPPGGDFTQALSPKYGGLSTNYEFQVVYADADNDAPADGVWVEIYDLYRIAGPAAVGAGTRFQMQKLNPLDNNYRAGVTYVVGVSGNHAALGYGRHGFRFFTHADNVTWPDPAPDYADNIVSPGQGPIVGSRATIQFMSPTWTPIPAPPAPGYEEGDRVRVEVQEADENLNPNVAETVTVTLQDTGMNDVETLVLTETGVNTGIFRGSIPMLGRLERPGDPPALNVIAGPTGNVITASYVDKDQGPDCPSDQRDSRTARALVVDTRPPVAMGDALRVENGADGHGRSLRALWPEYDIATSPTQVDIVGYDVYYSSAGAFTITNLNALPANVVHAGTATPATTMEYTITGLAPGTDYWVAVVPKDEVPNIAAAQSVGPTRTRDVRPPTLVAVTPVRNATEVPLTTHIIFRIQDPGVGINEGTVRVWVSRDGGAPLEITTPPEGWSLTRTGTAADRQYDYTPPAGFLGLNQEVRVRVQCDDNQPSPNRMDDNYEFHTRSDVTGPVIVNQTPAPGATNVLPTTPIRFRITDDRAGVDVNTLLVRINGTNVTENCTVDASDLLNVQVTYPATPPSIVPWGSDVTVTVDVADTAGNLVQQPNFWTYSTQTDEDPPAISNLSPAAGATNARIDTSISFRLTDAKSGINQATLEVYVNGTRIPDASLTRTGTANALNVSFDPPALFDYGQVVTVRVVVRDNAGNALPDEDPVITPNNGFEWRFTCRSAPLFRITGTIRDQAGDPVAAVTVRALDAATGAEVMTTRTDGNGTYIVEIELGGMFRIIPSRDEWDFSPSERTVEVDGADVTGQDFQGALRAYTISGRVTVGGVGLAGVSVSDGVRSALTDADGNYRIIGVPNGRYTVTPTLAGHTFRPTSRTVTIEGASQADVNFEAVGRTYTISGTVQDYDGNRLQGVRVTAGTRSAITNEAGMYTIGDVPPGTWAVTAEKAGYHLAPQAVEVQVPPDATGVNFTAHIAFANSFPQGINMIAVPCHPADPDPMVVFGGAPVARWNPTATPPEYVLPNAGAGQELLEVRPGRGFFVRLPGETLEVPGRPVSTARPFTLTLGPVWNMAGNMYTSALPFANIVPGLPGSIRQYGYVYDAARGDYLLVSSAPGVNVARTVIHPWEGIWLRASGSSATASVSPPVGGAEAAEVAPQAADLGADGWTIPVVARAGDRRDTTTAVGVGPGLQQAIQVENPPMAPSTVDAYIVAADGRFLAQDVRAGAAATLSWDIVVTTDLAGADVELALPDLSQVPHDLAVYLTDLDANRRVYARTMNAYTFTAGDAGDRRRFRLEVAPRSDAGLVVTNAAATSAGGAVVVSYSVSRACKVSVQVTNIAGRVIRALSDGRDVAAGVNTVNWDLKSATGTPVPNGRYLVRIGVMGEDGQQAQAVAAATVRR